MELLRKFHGKSPTELETDELFMLQYHEWQAAIARAIRAGLTSHSAVQDFIQTERSLGRRSTLRRARSGVERGTNRLMTMDDVRLRDEIMRLIRNYQAEHQKPLTKAHAKRLLVAPGTLPKMTPQAFNKLLRRLFVDGYFRG